MREHTRYLYKILLWGTRVNESYAGVCAFGMRPGVNSDMGCLGGKGDVDFSSQKC